VAVSPEPERISGAKTGRTAMKNQASKRTKARDVTGGTAEAAPCRSHREEPLRDRVPGGHEGHRRAPGARLRADVRTQIHPGRRPRGGALGQHRGTPRDGRTACRRSTPSGTQGGSRGRVAVLDDVCGRGPARSSNDGADGDRSVDAELRALAGRGSGRGGTSRR